jgi:hypothetical protein
MGTIYQLGNQKTYIKGQSIQWPQDTNRVIRRRKSKDSQWNVLITLLVFCGHCFECPLIYVFWLPYWYIVAIALSVLWSTASDYPVGIFTLLVTLLSVLWFIASDYPIGILWPLYWLSFDLDTNRVIRRRKSKNSQCNGQKCEDTNRVIRSCKSKDSQYSDKKCEDTNRGPLYCLSFDSQLLITLLVSSHFLSQYWLSFDLQLLITLFVFCGHCIDCPNSVIRRRKL